MKKITKVSVTLFTLTVLLGLAVRAEEGGTGHYISGGVATLIDLPPTQPGWSVVPIYLHYGGDIAISRALPLGGLLASGVDARIDAITLVGFHTFEKAVLGAHYSIGVALPFLWMDIEATLDTPMGSIRRTDSVDGLGDITLIPLMLAWKKDFWQFHTFLSIYAPTGNYDLGQLANAGLNYWTFEPTFGFSYNNAENGFNFAVHTGFTLNTENDATNYKSGSVLHVEASVQQMLPVGGGYATLGANGFIYEQISGDSGFGAALGGFEGRTIGIGPTLGYLKPGEKGTFVAEVKWLPELETRNRLQGDIIWVKFAYQF